MYPFPGDSVLLMADLPQQVKYWNVSREQVKNCAFAIYVLVHRIML